MERSKLDIFCSFELIHRFLKEDLKNAEDIEHRISFFSNITNSFCYKDYLTKG